MSKATLHRGWVRGTWAFMLILCATSVLACAGLATRPAPSPAAELHQAGLEAYTRGDYEQALSDFSDAIEADPIFGAAYFARGEVYYLLGDYERAIADFSGALEVRFQPAAQAYSARADAYGAIGDYAKKSDDYSVAYALDPDYVTHYYPGRQRAYSDAIKLNSELAAAYFARAWATHFLHDYTQAVADYTTALELNHEPVGPAYYWRGWAQYSMGDYEQSVADFSRAIEADPGLAEAYDGRAHGYIRLANYDLALADFGAAIEVDPDFARGHNNLCWFGSLLGQVTAVMESCERAVALEPNTPGYRDSRGLARALVGDYPGAIEDFRAYLSVVDAGSARGQRRVFWISELEAGRNPFDDTTLQTLLNE